MSSKLLEMIDGYPEVFVKTIRACIEEGGASTSEDLGFDDVSLSKRLAMALKSGRATKDDISEILSLALFRFPAAFNIEFLAELEKVKPLFFDGGSTSTDDFLFWMDRDAPVESINALISSRAFWLRNDELYDWASKSGNVSTAINTVGSWRLLECISAPSSRWWESEHVPNKTRIEVLDNWLSAGEFAVLDDLYGSPATVRDGVADVEMGSLAGSHWRAHKLSGAVDLIAAERMIEWVDGISGAALSSFWRTSGLACEGLPLLSDQGDAPFTIRRVCSNDIITTSAMASECRKALGSLTLFDLSCLWGCPDTRRLALELGDKPSKQRQVLIEFLIDLNAVRAAGGSESKMLSKLEELRLEMHVERRDEKVLKRSTI